MRAAVVRHGTCDATANDGHPTDDFTHSRRTRSLCLLHNLVNCDSYVALQIGTLPVPKAFETSSSRCYTLLNSNP